MIRNELIKKCFEVIGDRNSIFGCRSLYLGSRSRRNTSLQENSWCSVWSTGPILHGSHGPRMAEHMHTRLTRLGVSAKTA